MDLTRPTLDIYADLAIIGVEYANGRMSKNSYVEAACALGLSPTQAHCRALIYDKMRSPT